MTPHQRASSHRAASGPTRQDDRIAPSEPSHALAHVTKIAPTLPKDHLIVMNMCGRGDKDIFAVAQHLGQDLG